MAKRPDGPSVRPCESCQARPTYRAVWQIADAPRNTGFVLSVTSCMPTVFSTPAPEFVFPLTFLLPWKVWTTEDVRAGGFWR